MYAPQASAAVFSAVLAFSVAVIDAVPGLLLPCLVPALCIFIHISEFMNEIPLAQINGFVQGVIFALKRGGRIKESSSIST